MEMMNRLTRRSAIRLFGALSAAVLLAGGGSIRPTVQAQATSNSIVVENGLTGSRQSEWDIQGAGDPTLQGFATDISVNSGSIVSFKIKTSAPGFVIDIYRLGYYQGLGARKVATVTPSAADVAAEYLEEVGEQFSDVFGGLGKDAFDPNAHPDAWQDWEQRIDDLAGTLPARFPVVESTGMPIR